MDDSADGLDPSACLSDAVTRGDVKAAQRLLDQGADPSDPVAMPLHAAVNATSVNPLLRLLLDAGADPNTGDYESITPLFVASGRNGSTTAVKLLLEAGAKIEHRCDDGDTPLMWLPINATGSTHWRAHWNCSFRPEPTQTSRTPEAGACRRRR
jgi:ankyrin repeat protein